MSASAKDLHTIPDHIEIYSSFVLHCRASGRALWPFGNDNLWTIAEACVAISRGPEVFSKRAKSSTATLGSWTGARWLAAMNAKGMFQLSPIQVDTGISTTWSRLQMGGC